MVSFFLVAHNMMLPGSLGFGDKRESNVVICQDFIMCLRKQALQVRQFMGYQSL